MFDVIKQAMFTGLGLASLTKEKLEELGNDLARHAQLTADQAAKFQEDLTHRAAEARKSLDEEVDRRVEAVLKRLELVRVQDLRALEARIERLERDQTSKGS